MSIGKQIVGLLCRRVSAWVVLACSLALTYAAWHLSSQAVHREARLRFQSRAEDVRAAISLRILVDRHALEGGAALFETVESISRVQFRNYAKKLRLTQEYPGIRGIGFILSVPAGQLDRHIAAVRKEGFPDYRVFPECKRDQYFPVVYNEPLEGANLSLLGFDMRTEATRREALDHARDTGEARISGIVRLVGETEQAAALGFVMYIPVYAKGQAVLTVEQRRQALVGFVFSTFRVNELMKGVLGANLLGVRFRVFDGDIADPALLLYGGDAAAGGPAGTTPGADGPPLHSGTLHVKHGGRRWMLQFESLGKAMGDEELQPAMVAAAGLTVDLLLFWMVASLATIAGRATELAETLGRCFRR